MFSDAFALLVNGRLVQYPCETDADIGILVVRRHCKINIVAVARGNLHRVVDTNTSHSRKDSLFHL